MQVVEGMFGVGTQGFFAEVNLGEAEARARMLLEEARRRGGRFHPDVALARAMLGEALLVAGRTDEGLALIHRAQRRLAREHGALALRAAELLDVEGTVSEERGELAAAERCFRDAMRLREAVCGQDDPIVAISLDHLARLFSDARFEDDIAESFLERAVAILGRAPADRPELTARVLHNLAVLLLRQGELDAARAVLERAIDVRAATVGIDDPAIAPQVRDLAGAFAARGDLDTASALCRQALAIVDQALGPDSAEAVEYVIDLGRLAARAGREEEAATLYRRAAELRRAWEGPEDIDAAALTDLATDLDSGRFATGRARARSFDA